MRGFYRLPPQPAKPGETAAPTEYPFDGDRVVLIYKPGAAEPAQRWNIAFSGRPDKPVNIEVPVQLDAF